MSGEISIRTESHSSIQCFKQCKRQYYKRYISREHQELIECLEKGKIIHDMIHRGDLSGGEEVEYALKMVKGWGRTKYRARANYSWGKPKVKRIKLTEENGELYVDFKEEKYALGEDLKTMVAWDDPKCFFRGVVDHLRVYVDKDRMISGLSRGFFADGKLPLNSVSKSTANLIDWKTGKYRSYRRQLNWYTLFIFAVFPEVKEVNCQNVFVTQKKTSPLWVVKRKDAEKYREEIRESIESIRAERNWETTCTPLCKTCCFKESCIADGGMVEPEDFVLENLVTRSMTENFK